MPLRERVCGKCTVYSTLEYRPIPSGLIDVSEFLDESKNTKPPAMCRSMMSDLSRNLDIRVQYCTSK